MQVARKEATAQGAVFRKRTPVFHRIICVCGNMDSRLKRASTCDVLESMNADLQRLIELQQLDNEIRDVVAEIESLPQEIARVESTLNAHIQRVEAEKNALAENQKSRRKREGDIQAFRDKISHFKDQSIQVKTNEQYKAMMHEIEYHEEEIRKLEDQILGEMEESEALEQRLCKAEKLLAGEKLEVRKQIEQAMARKKGDEGNLEVLNRRRTGLTEAITPDIYASYERVTKYRKGLAVSSIHAETCAACHVHLRPQVLSEMFNNEKIIHCESCDRILYSIPEPVPQQK